MKSLDITFLSTDDCFLNDHMIGLGDRHNDNILIQKNGAVSHIDFDCIFEKGTILPIPEVRMRIIVVDL